MSTTPSNLPDKKSGEPAWRIALFYPRQGGWTEDDYFGLEGGPLVEFDDGHVEVLDMPTKQHQRIAQYLFLMLQAYVNTHRLGEVFMAPLPVRLWARKYREPDVVFVATSRSETDGYPDGADLVVEVVSEGTESRRRDREIKLEEYARAEIAEYWIIDPRDQLVIVHHLINGQYQATTYQAGTTATSKKYPDFNVSVAEILAAANGPAN